MFHYNNSKNPKLTNWPLHPEKNNKLNETEEQVKIKDPKKETDSETSNKTVETPCSNTENNKA